VIRIPVTAEQCAQAGAWPRAGDDRLGRWKSPVELAIGAVTGVDVDVDGDVDGWHATIGTMESSTLVVDLPAVARERLEPYYAHRGLVMEPFEFDLELDTWLVAFLAKAATTDEQADAVIRSEAG
jgi:hypothetical protein